MQYPLTQPGVDLYLNKFTDGNAVGGIPASRDRAADMNLIYDELIAVVTAAGLTPSEASQTQVRDSILALIKGGDYKDSVRVASTAAINLAAPGANIDGVAMVAGDRFLEKDNAILANRGIYIWNGAAVAATRALDADTGAELNSGAIIPVSEGTVNADTNWQLTTDGVVTIGATGLNFSLVNAGGRLANIRVFTASGTYTPIANIARARVRVIGGGGGGGGGNSVSAAGGGGGAAGGYSEALIAAATIGVSKTVTIGAAGGGGAINANGNWGGTSSFGAIMSATGGSYGLVGSSSATQSVQAGLGGTGSGGNINMSGGDGTVGLPAASFNGGNGGSSALGGGGCGAAYGVDAQPGKAAGSGGGAGYAAITGQAGVSGIIIIEEYI